MKSKEARQLLDSLKKRLDNLSKFIALQDRKIDVAVQNEINELSRLQIPELKSSIDLSIPTIENAKSQEITRISKRVDHLIRKYSGIEFINRKDELTSIVEDYSYPEHFLIVEAPTRYGKTALLDQAVDKFVQLDWFVCRVNLDEHPEAAQNKDAFLKVVLQALKDQQHPETGNFKKLDDQVTNSLAFIDRPIVFILDGAEKILEPDMLKWVRDSFIFEIAITRKKMVDEALFCFIVAGRYISTMGWQEEPGKDYLELTPGFNEVISLRPFDLDIVRKAVSQAHQLIENNATIKITNTGIQDLAKGIYVVSWGHPESVVSLLLEIGGLYQFKVKAMSHFREGFADLFAEHVMPACNAVLNDLPTHIRNLYPYICLFRCYDTEIISLILNWYKEHVQEKDSAELGADDVLKYLTQHGLISWNQEILCFEDDKVRRILALMLYLDEQNCGLATNLNRVAKEFYQEKIDEFTLYKGNIQRCTLFLTEHLYHWVMGVRYDHDSQQSNEDLLLFFEKDVLAFRDQVLVDYSGIMRTKVVEALIKMLDRNEEIKTELALVGRFDFNSLIHRTRSLLS